MTDLREKVAQAIYMSDRYENEPLLNHWESFIVLDQPCADFYRKQADAVLLIARPAIIEECARMADDIADDPPGYGVRHIDWQMGWQDGAMDIAAAIRTLAEKP